MVMFKKSYGRWRRKYSSNPWLQVTLKLVMGIVKYEENLMGDLIYNFNDYRGKNLFITIVEDELMGPAVPRTEAENLPPHILQTLAIIRVCLR